MRKFVWKVLGLLVMLSAVAVLYACAPTPEATEEVIEAPTTEEMTTEEAVEAPPAKELTFWTYTTHETGQRVLEEIVATFEQATNVEVEITYVPYEDMRTKILAAAKAGEAADVIVADGTWIAELAAAGALTSIDQYLTAEDQEDFLEAPLSRGNYQGKQYSLPAYVDVLALMYNKRMLEEKGVKVPETMEEFREACIELTDTAKGVWGFNAFHAGYWYLPFAWAWGGGMVTDDREILINKPESVEALKFYAGLTFDAKCSPPDIDPANDYSIAAEGFKEGKWAMTINGPWQVPDYLGGKEFKDDPDNLGIARIPRGPVGYGSPIGGGDNAVTTSAKDPALAYELVAHLTNTESQIKQAVENGLLPTRRSPYADSGVKANRMISAFLDQLEVAKSRPRIPEVESLFRDFDPNIQAVFLKEKTPEQALNDIATAWEGLLRR
jgi:arabinogalactan oligomer/maltooligosaccharide transport system substrate-binding protein